MKYSQCLFKKLTEPETSVCSISEQQINLAIYIAHWLRTFHLPIGTVQSVQTTHWVYLNCTLEAGLS